MRHAKPVGKFVNDQWLSSTMGLCDADDKAARELSAKSLRTFFGPDRPYLKDQTHLYEQLVESWGGVPEHLQGELRALPQGATGPTGAPEVDLSGGSGQIAPRCGTRSTPTRSSTAACSWPAIPRPACGAIAIHEEAGVDELQFLMATETVPHDKVMSSIEMFGKHVIPELKK